MKYFAIHHSLNRKIVGKIPHTKEVLYNCDVWDEPRFIDRMFYRKIVGLPILANAVLFPKAKLTDFINTYNVIGFTGSMLISDKFKKAFEKFNLFGLQFFPTFIIQNNIKIEGYWQTHISEQGFALLDFPKIDFKYKKFINDKVIYEDIENIITLEDFLKCKEENILPTELNFFNLKLKEDEIFDFFLIPHYINGNGYGIVSEKFKLEIESQGITGIEFRPIEIPLNEWLNVEREKKYGKI